MSLNSSELTLLIGTTNPGKVQEIQSALSSLPLILKTPLDLNITLDVTESGDSYESNARIKARHYAHLSNLNTLGEDSGIVIDALHDELGLHTRRWGAGKSASDQEWLDYFMHRMQDFPDPEQRSAKFVSTMCLIVDSKEYIFKGETHGIIADSILAPIHPGLPLSSVFIPQGSTKVYSALTDNEKNQISHRGQAARQIKQFFENQLV